MNDWEEGGRIEVRHVDRIFSKEQPSGPHQVLALMRRSPQRLTCTCMTLPASSQVGSWQYRKEKTMPSGANLMRSQVSYWAAQARGKLFCSSHIVVVSP